MAEFNIRAREERSANEKHIETHANNGTKVLSVDGSQATFKGATVRNLNSEGRRKFENALVINEVMKGKGPVKVIYR